MTEEVNTEPAVLVVVMSKWFGDFQALFDIDLTVDYGERFVICGPSGSGKSTLIRCHNQLEIHQKGTVSANGTEPSENTKNIEDVRRNVGVVFKSFNSFPHLSGLGNCVLADRRVLKKAKVVTRGTAMKYLEQVKIPEQHDKFPGQLSGGWRQRVVIARALCLEHKIVPLTTKQRTPFLTSSKVDLVISSWAQIQLEPSPSGSRRLMRLSYRELLRQRE